MYQDNTWAFGPLDTAQQLHGALELIEESGDGQWAGTQHYRSTAQRSFLAQKAYTRYLYSKIDKLGGLPYLNGDTNPNENFWESLPRDNDKDRVQYSDGTKVQWGRNPMYSELDDQGDSWTTYPPPGRSVTALGGSGAYDKRSNINWEYVLHDAGVLGDDPLKDPDYVAGRFKGIDDWMEYLGDEDHMFFDMVSGQYVLPGQETEHTVWNPETQTYVADHGYYWDDGKQELVQVGDESPGYQWNPETLHFEKPGPGPVTDSFAEIAKDDLGVTAEDLDAGLGAGQEIDEPEFMGPVIPDGYMLDDDGHLVYTPETAAEKDAEYATYLADAAAAAAAADAAAAQNPQVTPDETQGAGHVHADPYIAPTHELHHFAPDPTVPGHIPVDLIATQAAQGVKVI